MASRNKYKHPKTEAMDHYLGKRVSGFFGKAFLGAHALKAPSVMTNFTGLCQLVSLTFNAAKFGDFSAANFFDLQ